MTEKEKFINSYTSDFTLQTYKELQDKFGNTRKSFDLNRSLLKDNREAFKDRFGKSLFKIKDSSGRQVSVWKVSMELFTIYLLTAKERGSSYEILEGGDKLEAIMYLIELAESLK